MRWSRPSAAATSSENMPGASDSSAAADRLLDEVALRALADAAARAEPDLRSASASRASSRSRDHRASSSSRAERRPTAVPPRPPTTAVRARTTTTAIARQPDDRRHDVADARGACRCVKSYPSSSAWCQNPASARPRRTRLPDASRPSGVSSAAIAPSPISGPSPARAGRGAARDRRRRRARRGG